MAYRKRTLRKLPEVTREYCKLINEMQSILTRAKNLAERIESLELDSKALANAKGPDLELRKALKGALDWIEESFPHPEDQPATIIAECRAALAADCPVCLKWLAENGKLPDYCSSCGADRRTVLGEKRADEPLFQEGQACNSQDPLK